MVDSVAGLGIKNFYDVILQTIPSVLRLLISFFSFFIFHFLTFIISPILSFQSACLAKKFKSLRKNGKKYLSSKEMVGVLNNNFNISAEKMGGFVSFLTQSGLVTQAFISFFFFLFSAFAPFADDEF